MDKKALKQWLEPLLSFLAGGALLILGLGSLPYGVFHIGNGALLLGAGGLFLWPLLVHTCKAAHGRFIKACCALLLCGAASVLFLLCGMEHAASIEPRFHGEGETVLVLGCQVYPSGHPSLMLQGRLETAAAYLKDNPEATCIVSGGKGSDEPVAEGECMEEYLLGKGIAPERILVEKQSHNTEENIRFSMELAERKELSWEPTIITDDFHQYRALRLLEQQGYAANGTVSSRAPLLLRACYWAREMGGAVLGALGMDL